MLKAMFSLRHNFATLGTLTAMITMIGCSTSRELTRSKAAQLIASSEELKKQKLFFLEGRRYQCTYPEEVIKGWKEFEGVGFIEVNRKLDGKYFGGRPYYICEVVQTEKGRREFGAWGPLSKDTVGFQFGEGGNVPIATRKLLEVTGISQNKEADNAYVEFTWQWTLNKTGEMLRNGKDKFGALTRFW